MGIIKMRSVLACSLLVAAASALCGMPCEDDYCVNDSCNMCENGVCVPGMRTDNESFTGCPASEQCDQDGFDPDDPFCCDNCVGDEGCDVMNVDGCNTCYEGMCIPHWRVLEI